MERGDSLDGGDDEANDGVAHNHAQGHEVIALKEARLADGSEKGLAEKQNQVKDHSDKVQGHVDGVQLKDGQGE